MAPPFGIDGNTTDTVVGDADSGLIDQTNFIVGVSVSATKLNAILTGAGHAIIAKKSILRGLRGRRFAINSLAPEASPRGGAGYRAAALNAQAVGSVTVTVNDLNNGVMSYTIDGVSGSKPISRQPF